MTGSRSGSDPALPAERRRLGRVRLAGIAAALAMLFALLPGVGGGALDNGVFDLAQRLQPRDLTGTRAQVVAIDSESLRLIGPWPWSRYDLARLTERIGAAGATAIGFDMFFPEPDRQTPAVFARRYPELAPAARAAVLALPSFDSDFGAALGRFPTVLARAGVTERAVDLGETAYADPARLPVDAAFAHSLPAGVAAWPQAIASLPEIEETAAGHGLVNGDPDPDGIVRRIPAVGLIAGTPTPGFAVELARIVLGETGIAPVVAHGRLAGVTIGTRTVAVGPAGRYRLHFGTMPPGSVTPAAELFRRGFDPRAIRGKVVIVGVTGAGGVDVVSTPLETTEYGPYIQAKAVDAVLRGGSLDRPRWTLAAELGGGALIAGIAILLAGRLSGGRSTLLAGGVAIVVGAAAWFAFLCDGVLIDPLTPLLIGGAAAAGCFVSLAVETALVQRRLREALIDERVATARAAGEMAAARDIQRGMLPPRDALAVLDPRIDLDALLEPARAIGGDFYDAFALPGRRIAFLIGDVTGKGVPAALFMALCKALARGAIEAHPEDLGGAVAALSAALSRDNAEDMFVTMLVGTLDPASGALTLVNAGHEDPLRQRVDGGVEPIAMTGGPPVCVADDFPYEAEAFVLGAGEGLVIVTDGVTEAQDRAGGFFDRERAVAALAALPPDWHAGDATAALLAAVRRFEGGAEPSDDLTVLALRRMTVSG